MAAVKRRAEGASQPEEKRGGDQGLRVVLTLRVPEPFIAQRRPISSHAG